MMSSDVVLADVPAAGPMVVVPSGLLAVVEVDDDHHHRGQKHRPNSLKQDSNRRKQQQAAQQQQNQQQQLWQRSLSSPPLHASTTVSVEEESPSRTQSCPSPRTTTTSPSSSTNKLPPWTITTTRSSVPSNVVIKKLPSYVNRKLKKTKSKEKEMVVVVSETPTLEEEATVATTAEGGNNAHRNVSSKMTVVSVTSRTSESDTTRTDSVMTPTSPSSRTTTRSITTTSRLSPLSPQQQSVISTTVSVEDQITAVTKSLIRLDIVSSSSDDDDMDLRSIHDGDQEGNHNHDDDEDKEEEEDDEEEFDILNDLMEMEEGESYVLEDGIAIEELEEDMSRLGASICENKKKKAFTNRPPLHDSMRTMGTTRTGTTKSCGDSTSFDVGSTTNSERSSNHSFMNNLSQHSGSLHLHHLRPDYSEHRHNYDDDDYDREDSSPSLPGALMYMQNRSATSFGSFGSLNNDGGGGSAGHHHHHHRNNTSKIRRQEDSSKKSSSFDQSKSISSSSLSLSTVSSCNEDEEDFLEGGYNKYNCSGDEDDMLSRTSSSSSILSSRGARGLAETDTDESIHSLIMPVRRKKSREKQQQLQREEEDAAAATAPFKGDSNNKPLLLSSTSASSLYHSDVPIPPPSALSGSALGIAAILSNYHYQSQESQASMHEKASSTTTESVSKYNNNTSQVAPVRSRRLSHSSSEESSVGVIVDVYKDDDDDDDSSLSYDSSPAKTRRRRRQREQELKNKREQLHQRNSLCSAAGTKSTTTSGGKVVEVSLSSSSLIGQLQQCKVDDPKVDINDKNKNVVSTSGSSSKFDGDDEDDDFDYDDNEFDMGSNCSSKFESSIADENDDDKNHRPLPTLWDRVRQLSSRSLKYTTRSIRSLISQSSGGGQIKKKNNGSGKYKKFDDDIEQQVHHSTAVVSPPAIAFSYVVSPSLNHNVEKEGDDDKDRKDDDAIPLIDEDSVTPIPFGEGDSSNKSNNAEASHKKKDKKKKTSRRALEEQQGRRRRMYCCGMIVFVSLLLVVTLLVMTTVLLYHGRQRPQGGHIVLTGGVAGTDDEIPSTPSPNVDTPSLPGSDGDPDITLPSVFEDLQKVEWFPLLDENEDGSTNTLLEGMTSDSKYGTSLAISGNGKIMAVGGPTSHQGRGYVQVLEWDDSTSSWRSRGRTLTTGREGDQFGYSVDLNDDGSVIAIGVVGHDDASLTSSSSVVSDAGAVFVFKFHADIGAWLPVGSLINGPGEKSSFGQVVKLSSDGKTLAVIGVGRDDNTSNCVRVYKLAGRDQWKQVGQDIVDDVNMDIYVNGNAMDMSDDGTQLVIGSPKSGDTIGAVHVFRLVGGEIWESDAVISGGGNFGDQFGKAVSMSGDGRYIAATSATGWTRVLKYDPIRFGMELWGPVGDDIETPLLTPSVVATSTGNNEATTFRSSVSITHDEYNGFVILAVGTVHKDVFQAMVLPGVASVYVADESTSNIDLSWTSVMAELGGLGEGFGVSTVLSKNGHVVAIGAPDGGNGNNGGGSVVVLQAKSAT